MNGVPLKVEVEVHAVDVAYAFANMNDDDAGIEFLRMLDDKMASWDFTIRAAEFFIEAALKEAQKPGRPQETMALARVNEFLRQVSKQPHVQADYPIMGTWTDPDAEHAFLHANDLTAVVALAARGLRCLPPVEVQ